MARPKGIPAWNKGTKLEDIYPPEKVAELRQKAAENARRTRNRLGTTTSETAKLNISKSKRGKSSPKKGRTNTEMMGEEKARALAEKQREIRLLMPCALAEFSKNRAGKSNIEIFGESKAAEIAQKRREALKGKTYLEILGSEDKVLERNKKHASSMRKTWEQRWLEAPQESRDTTQYYEWQGAVLKRDNYTCQHCGISENELPKTISIVDSYLHCHHIKSWVEYPEFRYEINNGMTLCSTCHRKEESRLAIERQQRNSSKQSA